MVSRTVLRSTTRCVESGGKHALNLSFLCFFFLHTHSEDHNPPLTPPAVGIEDVSSNDACGVLNVLRRCMCKLQMEQGLWQFSLSPGSTRSSGGGSSSNSAVGSSLQPLDLATPQLAVRGGVLEPVPAEQAEGVWTGWAEVCVHVAPPELFTRTDMSASILSR